MVPLGTQTDTRSTIGISVAIRYRISEDVEGFTITTAGWTHTLYLGDDEHLRYDYHPHDTPRITFPHVHIGGAKAHTPTGRILVEDLLILALEHGAKPRSRDWKARLTKSRDTFRSDCTWGTLAGSGTDTHWLDRWDDDANVNS